VSTEDVLDAMQKVVTKSLGTMKALGGGNGK